MLQPLAISFLLLATIFAFTNGLKCVRCRIDSCTHDYCDQSNQLFISTSNDYFGIEGGERIPTCPHSFEDRKLFGQECSSAATSCGYFHYTILTQADPIMVPLPGLQLQAEIPIVGGGRKSYSSNLVILGCVQPTHECRKGQSYTIEIPANRTRITAVPDSPSLEQVKKSIRLAINNTFSHCLKCEADWCNNNNNGPDPISPKPSDSPPLCQSSTSASPVPVPATNKTQNGAECLNSMFTIIILSFVFSFVYS